jgi:hypothetical protein
MDLSCELSADGLTAGRLLQGVTKAAVEQCELADLIGLISTLHLHHPSLLEPLASLLIAKYV